MMSVNGSTAAAVVFIVFAPKPRLTPESEALGF
jgi:hypothetical protein